MPFLQDYWALFCKKQTLRFHLHQTVLSKIVLRLGSRIQGKDKKSPGHILIDQMMIFGIFKLWDDLSMMNDGTHNELWEESNEQEIIQYIIVLCLTPERIHQKGNELECKERDSNGQYNVQQLNA